MEQRPLRLGDTVDDYCPRERRITNHVIVVIVDDAIRQTRCSTCDVEHAYKDAREPRRRKKDASAAGDAVNGQLVASRPAELSADEVDELTAQPEMAAVRDELAASSLDASPADDQAPAHDEHGPAHRRLIRATLPRIDGEPPPVPRPIPEFTMHQRPHGRGGHQQRPRQSWSGGGEPNGNTFRHGHGAPSGGRDGGRPGQGGGKPGRHRGKHKRPR